MTNDTKGGEMTVRETSCLFLLPRDQGSRHNGLHGVFDHGQVCLPASESVMQALPLTAAEGTVNPGRDENLALVLVHARTHQLGLQSWMERRVA